MTAIRNSTIQKMKFQHVTNFTTDYCASNDRFGFIFTHFLKHFYKGGLGLRQICDWCRLLASPPNPLSNGRGGGADAQMDVEKLEGRLRRAGLMSEWKAFGTFAVECLGMPSEAMPFYSLQAKWKRKAKRILTFVMMSGNFGHNRD